MSGISKSFSNLFSKKTKKGYRNESKGKWDKLKQNKNYDGVKMEYVNYLVGVQKSM